MRTGLISAVALAGAVYFSQGGAWAQNVQSGSDLWWLQHHGARPPAPAPGLRPPPAPNVRPAAPAQGPGGGFGDGQYAGRHDGDRWRYRDAGIGAGLVAGALVGGALAAQQGYYSAPVEEYPVEEYPVQAYPVQGEDSPAADEDYCSRRYRSYDPSSGTYVGYDGYPHPCP